MANFSHFKFSHSFSMVFPSRRYLLSRKITENTDIWEGKKRDRMIHRVMAPAELFFVSQHNLCCNPVCSKKSAKGSVISSLIYMVRVCFDPRLLNKENTVADALNLTPSFMKKHVTVNINSANSPHKHCFLSLL